MTVAYYFCGKCKDYHFEDRAIAEQHKEYQQGKTRVLHYEEVLDLSKERRHGAK